MPRKSKRKRTESAPTKEAQAKPISISSAEFGEFIESQGGSAYLTPLPGAKDAGLPFVGIISTPENLKSDLFLIEAGTAIGKHETKKQRDPKPRKTDRDDEIVRLRDIEKKTFGEIGRLLVQKDAKWCRNDGKPLTRDAVEKAYHRRKAVPTK